jgi:WD40 repeat protein
MTCLTRIQLEGTSRVRDIAWHPRGDVLVITAGGRAIELWSVPDGRLIREYGERPLGPRTKTYYGIQRHTFSVEDQGYGNVIFSENGNLLVAGGSIEDRTEVFHASSGELVDTFWSSDSTFALHPEGEILATLSSDQLASAVRFGRLVDTFQGYDCQLNVTIDGYRRLVFSPRGNAFAVMGHAYRVGVRIYEFPSCRCLFELDFETWEEVWDCLWREFRGAERYAPKPDGSCPYEFIRDLWTVNDRLAFHADGRSLLIGTLGGFVVGIDPEDTSKPSGKWVAHEGPVLALDVSTAHAMLATAHCDGEIRLWKLDGAVATPALDGKPMTEAFINMFDPIDSMASEEQSRTTDGKRWYDLETIGDEEIDEAEPPWVQIAKLMRWNHRPNS